jgi:diacylglycerol kinase (ATP)
VSPAAVIVNPHARQGKAAALAPLIKAWLKEQQSSASVHLCGTPESLQAVFASLPKGSRVIGVGGDGTNHRLLPHLLAGQHKYGLVPYGSGDDLARALGLFGLSWQAALQHALSAPSHPIDLGQAQSAEGQSRPFLGCFLFGLDGLINNQTAHWKLRGPIPYFLTLLKQLPNLRGWRLHLSYRTKSEQITLPTQHQILCSLLNTPTYGSGYPIAPMTQLADGTLTLLHAPMVGRLKFLQLFAKMLSGKHVGAKECHFAEISELQVRSEGELLSLSADGEVIEWQTNAVSVVVLPGALRVVGG